MSVFSYFNLKIFFRFFHKTWWIIILVALFLKLIVPESEWVSSFLINISATALLFKLSTIIHEYGHLAMAQLVGGIPRRMILGTGHEILRTEVKGVKIILNSIPVGGLAWATFDDDHLIKWRYAAYFSGGVAFNGMVACVCYLLFGFDPSYFTGEDGVDIPSASREAIPIIETTQVKTYIPGNPVAIKFYLLDVHFIGRGLLRRHVPTKSGRLLSPPRRVGAMTYSSHVMASLHIASKSQNFP